MERKAKQRSARAEESTALISVVEYDVRSSRAHAPPLSKVWRPADSRLVADGTPSASPPRSRPTWLVHELFDMFLPAGYPSSVTEDYLPFQLWDTCQAMCSYLRGVLATQSVLESVGVGNEAITPLAAALQWVMRDGSGMLGGLFFAYGVGPKFDANVKFWRLYADVINDVGLTLDMLAPFAPFRYVTQILCVSSVCKAMCGVAAGATRSSLTAHFAKADNMAGVDYNIAAKEGSQETFVTLLGLLTGMYFANLVNQSRASVWVAFLLLTAIHVVANYKAVTSLCIPTLNQARATLAIRSFRGSQTQRLSIARVNAMEPILPRRDGPGIVLGGRLPLSLDLPSLLALHKDDHYVLTVDAASSTVVASLFVSATPMDELKAYFNAVVLADAGAPTALSALATAHAATTTEFPAFVETMENLGWKMHSFPLSTQPTRYAIARGDVGLL